ncbi:hypothetical protein FHS18_005101 [Paenibacillus phyllosphaerae]|uniref:Uncharacterized protein n=1 Tax=Paenibacillus phyllosphaerae TaxID=274593 RepID=A0A7W5B208_9BACL|nr:hypothetical protein [Paenibacillus phyllosphaerae]MBB3112999.1 hypothetical protein [Paenibacillus phyllosphaerae]
MRHDTALLFRFPDAPMAALAADTLKDLGYEPDLQGEQEVHIHLHGSDLTSALEIAQSHGGVLAGQSPIQEGVLTQTAYSLDSIQIPAHLVNEDLVAQEELNATNHLRNRDDDGLDENAFLPDAGTYGFFSGDVHI